MKPVLTEQDGIFGDTFEHPAFGCVEITSPTGKHGKMFMSNVDNNRSIRVTIKGATLRRGLNHDGFFSEKSIVSFSMTPNQFADMVSSAGRAATPCTLEWVQGQGTLPPIHQEPTTKRFVAESEALFKEMAKQIKEVIDDTAKALTEAKVSKTRQDAILAPISAIRRKLIDNLPFMQTMFVESIEDIIHEAKSVIDSFAAEQLADASVAPTLLGGS